MVQAELLRPAPIRPALIAQQPLLVKPEQAATLRLVVVPILLLAIRLELGRERLIELNLG